ncbi:MAG TPA: N-acetyltransferase [Micavibrio sp.]|jgi:GNAT superfamily N-acetyltransferase|nr:N-acetyltransferase [Micavibrio sp.]
MVVLALPSKIKFDLRDSHLGDWDFLRELYKEALYDSIVEQFGEWEDSRLDEFFTHAIKRGADFTIITSGGKDIGAMEIVDDEEFIQVEEILLLPAYQNKGIGSKIIKDVIAVAERKEKPVTLYVLKESRAKDFYEKHGFAYKSNTPTHYFMIWDPRAH